MNADENDLNFNIRHDLAWNGGGILSGETGDGFNCEKCDVKFLGAGALHNHKLRGNSATNSRKHFYCGKCRIDFQNEAELKGHLMESSAHVVCRECSQEFLNVEALELHSQQVCFQLFFLSTLEDIWYANTRIRSTSPSRPILIHVPAAMSCSSPFPPPPSISNPDSAKASSQQLTFVT